MRVFNGAVRRSAIGRLRAACRTFADARGG